jgi:hypothetical protein
MWGRCPQGTGHEPALKRTIWKGYGFLMETHASGTRIEGALSTGLSADLRAEPLIVDTRLDTSAGRLHAGSAHRQRSATGHQLSRSLARHHRYRAPPRQRGGSRCLRAPYQPHSEHQGQPFGLSTRFENSQPLASSAQVAVLTRATTWAGVKTRPDSTRSGSGPSAPSETRFRVLAVDPRE